MECAKYLAIILSVCNAHCTNIVDNYLTRGWTPTLTDQVNQCKSCTSDNGENPGCEENFAADTVPSVACSVEFGERGARGRGGDGEHCANATVSGNDYCYVLVTHNKQPAEGWVWNSENTLKMSSVLISSKIFFLSKSR